MTEPELVMLDEPSLDPAPAAVRIMQRVRNLNRDHLDSFGTTTFR